MSEKEALRIAVEALVNARNRFTVYVNVHVKKDTEKGDRKAASNQDMVEMMNDIRDVINRHSRENFSDTPDYILAHFILNSLLAFETATRERTAHMGPDVGNETHKCRFNKFGKCKCGKEGDPHHGGDYSYLCGSDYCRCTK